MNEYIEISLRRHNRPLRIKRQVPGGIELDERNPIERSVQITFDAANEITRYRLRRVRQIQGWQPGEFKLLFSVEDGSIVLRGIDAYSLPEGVYRIAMNIEEAKTRPAARTVKVSQDGGGTLDVVVELDDRGVDADLSMCDTVLRSILERSTIDDQNAIDWLDDEAPRATRKACLLNVLASLRARPKPGDHLAQYVRDVFWVEHDRVYATVDREMFDRFESLAADPSRPFYREGRPRADIHLRLLDRLPEPPDRRVLFAPEALVSFRGEGQPSLQAVIVKPPAGLTYTYAEFDLDLGNALQDITGFVVHMGELVDGKSTNHLDLRARLAKGPARDFLYYAVA